MSTATSSSSIMLTSIEQSLLEIGSHPLSTTTPTLSVSTSTPTSTPTSTSTSTSTSTFTSTLPTASLLSSSRSPRSPLSIVIPELNVTHTQTQTQPPFLPLSTSKPSPLSDSPSLLSSPEKEDVREVLASLIKLEDEEREFQRKRNGSLTISCSSLVDTTPTANATTQTSTPLWISSQEPLDKVSEDLVLFAEASLFGLDGQSVNEARAFRLLCIASERYACPNALALVGFCHEFGLGTPQDFAKCESPYLAAAQHRHPLAMTRLSFLKRYGRPYVKMNRVEANHWQQELQCLAQSPSHMFHSLHNQVFDHPLAQTPLAWLWWASDVCKHPAAQYSLGTCFHDGVGVTKSPENAVHWYMQSASQGHPRGQGILGYCYGEGFGIAQNEKLALNWYLKAASQGETVAMYNVGYCYEEGLGLTKDYTQSFVWYQRAANQGNGLAANSLGYFYEEGLGVEKDLTQAVHWYTLAAEWGNPWAEHNLGFLYSMGLGVEKNFQTAFHWFHRAALQGHAGAQNRVGQCYQLGQGVDLDLGKAVEWYRSAAQEYHGPACVNLAWCLEHGVGTPRDFLTALEYIDKAIQVHYESSHGVPLVDWAIHLALKVDLLKSNERSNALLTEQGAPTPLTA